MKRLLRTLVPALLCLAAYGQDAPDGEAPSEIFSDESVYDQKSNVLHYWGNVRLNSPGTLNLTCEDFLVQLGAGGSRLNQITATTNVVLHLIQPGAHGRPAVTNVAYAHRAIFDGISNTVTLAMSPDGVRPRFESGDLVSEAEEITYNRVTERLKLKGRQLTRFKPGNLPKGGFFGPKPEAAPASQ